LDADERARFERAALPHLDAAYNLARWLTRDPHAAEDVVQEAFLRAARFFAGCRAGDGRAWLLAIVRRAAYDWLARRRAIAAEPIDDAGGPIDAADGPEELALRAADRATVREAVAGLPPEYREVIVLRELEGLSYQEIATVAGVPVGTVMSRLSRGREHLRRRLVPCPGGEE
jgi:RNA polymerase sigma-70 factor (ECF subfamily)